jgi:hypothetical protein
MYQIYPSICIKHTHMPERHEIELDAIISSFATRSPSPCHFPTSSWAHARRQMRPIESFRVPQKLQTQGYWWHLLALVAREASHTGDLTSGRRLPHTPPGHSQFQSSLRWAELKEETKKRRGLGVSFCSPASNLSVMRSVCRSSHRRAISEWKRRHGQHRHRIHF